MAELKKRHPPHEEGSQSMHCNTGGELDLESGFNGWATLGSRLSRRPFAERSRSELTRHWGSLGFGSAQPTEPVNYRF